MADQHDRVAGPAHEAGGNRNRRRLLALPVPQTQSGSARTVALALAANLLVAVAKSVAAAMTGSASMTAEAAHSWADTGNELFLVAANKRSARPARPSPSARARP